MSKRQTDLIVIRRARYFERYWRRGIKFKPGWMRLNKRHLARKPRGVL